MNDSYNVNHNLEKPIVLIGMMGVGKTALGGRLAEHLGCAFYDSDRLIVKKAGMEVPDIFESFGEEKFREVEQTTITDLLSGGLSVIATGGGAMLRDATRKAVLDRGVAVWLDVKPEILWERLKDCTTRPLLNTDNPQETLYALIAERRPAYEQAHIHIQVSDETSAQVLNKITNALAEYAKSAKT